MYKLINSQWLEALSNFELKLFKNLFQKLSAITIISLKKVKVLRKISNKKILQEVFKSIFHGQTSWIWGNRIFSRDIGRKPITDEWNKMRLNSTPSPNLPFTARFPKLIKTNLSYTKSVSNSSQWEFHVNCMTAST